MPNIKSAKKRLKQSLKTPRPATEPQKQLCAHQLRKPKKASKPEALKIAAAVKIGLQIAR